MFTDLTCGFAGAVEVGDYIVRYAQKTATYGYYKPDNLDEFKSSYPKTLGEAISKYGTSIPCTCCGRLNGGSLRQSHAHASPNCGRYALSKKPGAIVAYLVASASCRVQSLSCFSLRPIGLIRLHGKHVSPPLSLAPSLACFWLS